MPTKEQAREKRYAIQQRNFILENRAIVPMDKSSILPGPSSIAAEKIRLRTELETVDDVVEVERIKARLQELDAARLTERDGDAMARRLAEMNRKNKIENLRNASQKKSVNANLKAGDPGYDPFSRRWTRSTNYFLAKSSTEGQKNDDATAAVADSSTGAGIEAASVDVSAPSAAAGAGKSVDASAAVEQGADSLHNFELSISLDALQKFGGPKGVKGGFMARKQRIEANLGCKVPEDDGRKHDRALTVTEYMKRRGNEAARRGSISRNSAVNNKPPTLAICGSTSRSRSGANDVNRELALNAATASDGDEEDIRSKTKVLTYENIRDITIQRSTLEKWFTESFFEELIVGCFVRVAIGSSLSGPVYRLCPVRSVDRRGPDCTYEFDNKATNKYLNLAWGPDYTATNWRMISVSNASPTREEFDQWLSVVKRFGDYMPTKEQAREKRYAIHQRNFILENRTIVPMDKSSFVQGPSNIAAEKVRLRSELETVDDVVEVERIKGRLQELDAARLIERDGDAKALRLAEMNRRNKIENLRNAAEKKPVNANLKAGDPGYDPFSRRWTRSINYFLAKSGTGGKKTDDANAAVADTSTGAGTEAASGASKSVDTSAPSAQAKAASGSAMSVDASAPSATAGAGKSVDASAAVEQGTDSLHNFELSISLAALQKFRGPKGVKAGFMARKQRIEANLGHKVPEDDGGSMIGP
ncbi:UNVERIFIED_CONTAM: protein RTF1 [Sesamum latifolium]|uniref:Protein RTF1 n=1 Tax=Sesamum latifolium TaxID=2727402 RepID=A0AAW2TS21_9LAMI